MPVGEQIEGTLMSDLGSLEHFPVSLTPMLLPRLLLGPNFMCFFDKL